MSIVTAFKPKSVGDLCALVGDGQTRIFTHRLERTGEEPAYYRLTTVGEYPERPRWDNPLPIGTRPRPATHSSPHRPLGDTQYRFSIDVDRNQLADLYRVTPGVFLVSTLLLGLLDEHGVGPVERSVAQLNLRGGAVTDDFHVVIPAPVLDIVDIEKTDVKIARDEVVPEAGKFVTLAKFPNGQVFLASAPLAFLGKYDGNWWWREGLVRAAVVAGVRGLRAVHSYNTAYEAEIRTL